MKKLVLIFFCLSFTSKIFAHSMEQAILQQVNSYRAQWHLKPLKLSNAVSRVAEKHSVNMAKHNIPFGHANFYSRIQSVFKMIPNQGYGAENVAYNYKSAQSVVNGWIRSPLHLKNIKGDYDVTGIGIAKDKQGRMYFTQLFVKT